MKWMRTLWFLLLPLAAFGLWTMLASPRSLFGIDLGALGMFAPVASTVAALSLLAKTSRADLEDASPAEWKAWIGTGFMLVGVVYFLTRMSLFTVADWRDPHVGAVSRNLVLLLVAGSRCLRCWPRAGKARSTRTNATAKSPRRRWVGVAAHWCSA